MIKQIDKPVQFSLVPFAASVNVGAGNDNASWIDAYGLSPVHNENFDWSTLNAADKYAQKIGGIWYKKGTGWGEEEGQMLTRFSLYRDMKVVTSHERIVGSKRVVCDEYRCNNTCARQPQRIRLQRHLRPVRQLAGLRRGPPLPLQCRRHAGIRRAEQHRHRHRRSGDHVRADVCARRAGQSLEDHPGSRRSRRPRPMAPPTAGGTTIRRAPPARPGSRNMAKYFQAAADQRAGAVGRCRSQLQLHHRRRSRR